MFKKKITIANLAKDQVIARQVKGLATALVFAQKRIHNSLFNLS